MTDDIAPIKRDHSRKFNEHAWSDHKTIKELVDHVWHSFSEKDKDKLTNKSNNQGKSASYIDHLRILLVDFYVGWKTDPSLCTALSRNNNDYKPTSRYNALHTSKNITKVLDVLVCNGYLDVVKGAHNRDNSRESHRTRYRPTCKLRSMYSRINLSEYDINLNKRRECIVLREKDANADLNKDLEYEDTNATVSMRREVEAYNALMQNHYVDVASLEHPYFVNKDENNEGHKKPIIYPVDQLQKFTRRIFGRNDWKCNGRWHGGFWQNLKKHVRRDILIDDEPTDEIDYSGLHPSILAIEAGETLTGDRYDLGGQVCDNISISDQRKTVKGLVLIAINAANRQQTFAAFHKDNKGYKTEDLKKLLDAFIEKYPFLENSICSDQGIRLMNVDSNITAHILKEFVELKKPILPIHDSYIVKKEDVDLLRAAMSRACKNIVGSDIEAESRGEENARLIKHAEAWKNHDRDYYQDIFDHVSTKITQDYRNRYKLWKDSRLDIS